MAKKTAKKTKATAKKASKKNSAKKMALAASASDEFRWLCEDCSKKGASWTTEAQAEAGANKHMAEYVGHVATVEQK